MFHDENQLIENQEGQPTVNQKENDGFFQGVPPKTGFIFGIVSGIAIISLLLLIIGFSSKLS